MNAVADLTIKYVNQPKPGKQLGNVKDINGELYLVPPAMLTQFSPGMVCKVEFTTSTGQDGTVWKKVAKVIGSPGAPVPAKQQFMARKAPNESRQIGVLAIVKEWVGQIPVGDTAMLVTAIKSAMAAYDETLGGDRRRDDLDDENPF